MGRDFSAVQPGGFEESANALAKDNFDATSNQIPGTETSLHDLGGEV
ncbi:MAG: hypothetical protein ACYCPT_14040 [Acidimicrobiales bacterium]